MHGKESIGRPDTPSISSKGLFTADKSRKDQCINDKHQRKFSLSVLMTFKLARQKLPVKTRMHSSGMRTARLLTISHNARGGGLPNSFLDADPPDAGDPLVRIIPCPRLSLRAVINYRRDGKDKNVSFLCSHLLRLRLLVI